MKRLFTLRTFMAALLFGVLYSLVIATIGKVAVDYWGRPRGVAYGIFGYYYWVALSIYGLAMVFVFRAIPIRYALATFLTIITVPTFLLLPDQGERPILAVYAGAITMCLALAAWEHHHTRRRKRLT
ncbi:hypothetical protein LZ190_14575 [Rhodovulum sulfidophilum]|nr:hypothetical protein [Rhodovulum sulfidophilum]